MCIAVAVLQKQHISKASASTTTSTAALAASENLLVLALSVPNVIEKVKVKTKIVAQVGITTTSKREQCMRAHNFKLASICCYLCKEQK